VVNRLVWQEQYLGLTQDDVVLQDPIPSMSRCKFFSPLLVGAKLVMLRPDGHKDPAHLLSVPEGAARDSPRTRAVDVQALVAELGLRSVTRSAG
jgi:hypothetical protein